MEIVAWTSFFRFDLSLQHLELTNIISNGIPLAEAILRTSQAPWTLALLKGFLKHSHRRNGSRLYDLSFTDNSCSVLR